jgi:exodeoxyribonuclease VII large subunit
MLQKLTYDRSRLKEYMLRLFYGSPAYQIRQKRQYLIDTESKLRQQMNQKLKEKRHMLELMIARLNGLSPLSKLSRGYALVAGEDNKPIRSIENVNKKELLTISLLDGDIKARAEELIEITRGGGAGPCDK